MHIPEAALWAIIIGFIVVTAVSIYLVNTFMVS